jgi:hypothetical protein
MHSRSARAEGDLDQRSGGLLSARADDLLGDAQIRWVASISVSHTKRFDARGIGDIALARPSTTRDRWRVVGFCAVGIASGDGAIGRVGYRAEKHAVLPVLSVLNLLLLKLGEAIAHNADDMDKEQLDLWSVTSLFRTRDFKQAVCSHVTRRACAVYLVAATSHPMA